MSWENFVCMAGSNERKPNQLRAHRIARDTRTKPNDQKIKILSAVIILSAAVITPLFAQDAGARRPGSRSFGKLSPTLGEPITS
jgi:hypothetical protein